MIQLLMRKFKAYDNIDFIAVLWNFGERRQWYNSTKRLIPAVTDELSKRMQLLVKTGKLILNRTAFVTHSLGVYLGSMTLMNWKPNIPFPGCLVAPAAADVLIDNELMIKPTVARRIEAVHTSWLVRPDNFATVNYHFKEHPDFSPVKIKF